ncbi:MAG: hypothetical protein P8Q36_20050 [Alphaproteobacteria bacterium]|nr:hypothetical protein [Alphaproteobacteria bacterium]
MCDQRGNRINQRGDVLRLVGAGGGGWGDPATRDAVLTDRDRVEGYA